jgi:hypothetical protein
MEGTGRDGFVRGLSRKTVNLLKERAGVSGLSLQQEVKDILERRPTTLTMEEARRLSARSRARLGGRSFSDSAEQIREDLDSRWPPYRCSPRLE